MPACALSCLSRVQLFATPWTVAHQVPLSLGFSRQERWSGFPFPPPGGLSDPAIEPTSLTSPALAGRFFTTSANHASPVPRWLRKGTLPTLPDGIHQALRGAPAASAEPLPLLFGGHVLTPPHMDRGASCVGLGCSLFGECSFTQHSYPSLPSLLPDPAALSFSGSHIAGLPGQVPLPPSFAQPQASLGNTNFSICPCNCLPCVNPHLSSLTQAPTRASLMSSPDTIFTELIFWRVVP